MSEKLRKGFSFKIKCFPGKGLDIINNDPERLVRLRQNSEIISVGLKEAFNGTRFTVNGNPLSPLKHIYYQGNNDDEKLNELVKKVSQQKKYISSNIN